MRNKVRKTIAQWVVSWRDTFRELFSFAKAYSHLVIICLLIAYGIVYGILLTQYYIVKNSPGRDYLVYRTVIVSDVSVGQQAEGKFIRDSVAQYDGYGKIEFDIHDDTGKTYTPPPVDYPKHIQAGHDEQKERIPTQNFKPGKYSFTLHRKFQVDTWIGWKVEKEVTAVSDEFEVKSDLKTEAEYREEMKRLYEEFKQRASEYDAIFQNLKTSPEVQTQVIITQESTTAQTQQKTTSGGANPNANPNAPGQIKKNI